MPRSPRSCPRSESSATNTVTTSRTNAVSSDQGQVSGRDPRPRERGGTFPRAASPSLERTGDTNEHGEDNDHRRLRRQADRGPAGHQPDRGGEARPDRDPPLLFPSAALGRRAVPYVPGRNRRDPGDPSGVYDAAEGRA